ncbi:MAG: hypothetical protein N2Z58_06465 [Fervidobacterium sp.]|nr:hypothetical protein [Fervidobacterium sp.]
MRSLDIMRLCDGIESKQSKDVLGQKCDKRDIEFNRVNISNKTRRIENLKYEKILNCKNLTESEA